MTKSFILNTNFTSLQVYHEVSLHNSYYNALCLTITFLYTSWSHFLYIGQLFRKDYPGWLKHHKFFHPIHIAEVPSTLTSPMICQGVWPFLCETVIHLSMWTLESGGITMSSSQVLTVLPYKSPQDFNCLLYKGIDLYSTAPIKYYFYSLLIISINYVHMETSGYQ